MPSDRAPDDAGSFDAVVASVHAGIAASLDAAPDDRGIAELVRARDPLAPPARVDATVLAVRQRLAGLGALQPLLDDPQVSEVMVNGPDRPVWVERSGRLEATPVVLDAPTVVLTVERVVGPLGLRVDRTRPTVDARLADGSRVNVVVPPVAVDGPCITIRRFGARGLDLHALCPPGVASLLAWAVRARLNLVAVGGTGAGKTTLLNALAAALPAGERIITVEDAAELRLPHPHVVRLESRGELRALLRNALRMRPDRIVVGEVRGPEALDLLLAMNTGHEGALSTCHANSTADALWRLETMVLLAESGLPLDAVRRQLGASLDLVVMVARRPDGSRAVVEVAELDADGGGVRVLADAAGLHALPARLPRAAGVQDPDDASVTRR
jgi:pilus assembly protein CpaF